MLGHLSSEYLDASSLALLWMNPTMQMCVRGLKGAVNTLVSQAIGAGNDELAGLWLRVAYMLAPVFSAFVVGMWLLAGPVLTLVVASGAAGGEAGSGGDDGRAAACDLAARYTRLSIGWVLPTMVLEATSSHLLARRVAMPQLLVYSCFFLVNLGLNVLFVHGAGGWAGLGFDGSPIATTATRVGQLLSLLAVLRLRGVAAVARLLDPRDAAPHLCRPGAAADDGRRAGGAHARRRRARWRGGSARWRWRRINAC